MNIEKSKVLFFLVLCSLEHVAHIWSEIGFEKKIEFDNSFYVTKCLKQIAIPYLLHMCITCSELPCSF